MDQRLKQYQKEGRAEAKRLFPVPDVLCSCGSKVTDRHHIDGDTHNNVADNIGFYCHKCHLRLERQARHVGSHTRLTQEQIDLIKQTGLTSKQLSTTIQLNQSYINDIKSGKSNPVPYTPVVVPDDWIPATHNEKQVRFARHALTPEQVKELRRYTFMRQSLADVYAEKWHVTASTIYKAKAGQGGYGHPRFNI